MGDHRAGQRPTATSTPLRTPPPGTTPAPRGRRARATPASSAPRSRTSAAGSRARAAGARAAPAAGPRAPVDAAMPDAACRSDSATPAPVRPSERRRWVAPSRPARRRRRPGAGPGAASRIEQPSSLSARLLTSTAAPILPPTSGAGSLPRPPSSPALVASDGRPAVARRSRGRAPRSPEPGPGRRRSAAPSAGRRVASRRTRVPSPPLLDGHRDPRASRPAAPSRPVHPDLAGAADGHTSPPPAPCRAAARSARPACSATAAPSVSRDADRQTLSAGSGTSLQAAADAQAQAARRSALAVRRARPQKQAAKIQLHQWVLPVTPASTT